MLKNSILKLKQKISQSSSKPTTMCSTPTQSISERNTYRVPIIKQFTQNFYNFSIKDQVQSISKNTDFVKQKSLILFEYDQKLKQFIQKCKPYKKSGQKMKIFSMKKVKLKRNQQSIESKKNIKTNKSQYQFTINFDFNNFRRLKQKSTKLGIKENSVNRRAAGLYVKTTRITALRCYLNIMLSKYEKTSKKRKSQLLIDELINYLDCKEEAQIQKDLIQIESISEQMISCLKFPGELLPVHLFRLINRDLTKLIFNIFYQIYRKKQINPNSIQLIKINKQIQYASRKLNFFSIALRTCFDLGKIYCDKFEYDKAFDQYSNAIKLAVYLNNVFYQQVAIDKLGICKFYLGDSASALYFHNNLNNLSQYDLNRIKQQYSNQHQIQRLVEEKKQISNSINSINKQTLKKRLRRADSISKQNKDCGKINQNNCNSSLDKIDIEEFTFDKQNRQEDYPYFNSMQFKSNLKKVIKIPELHEKIHIIKRNLKKNDQVGIKKYFGQQYIIPKANMLAARKETNNQENSAICLSHRSNNRRNFRMRTEKLEKQMQFLLNILVFFRDYESPKMKQTQILKYQTNLCSTQTKITI